MKEFFLGGTRFDSKIIGITVVSTILLIVEKYHTFSPWKPFDRTILYLLFPMAIILLVIREDPRNYGFRIGEWKVGLSITLAANLILFPILWFLTSRDLSMRSYYQPLLNQGLPVYTFFDLLGW